VSVVRRERAPDGRARPPGPPSRRRRSPRGARVVTHHAAPAGGGEALAERVGPGVHRRPAREQDEWCVVVTEGLDAQGDPIGVDGGHRSTVTRAHGPGWIRTIDLRILSPLLHRGDGGKAASLRDRFGGQQPASKQTTPTTGDGLQPSEIVQSESGSRAWSTDSGVRAKAVGVLRPQVSSAVASSTQEC
jgi:hypothetical protein